MTKKDRTHIFLIVLGIALMLSSGFIVWAEIQSIWTKPGMYLGFGIASFLAGIYIWNCNRTKKYPYFP